MLYDKNWFENGTSMTVHVLDVLCSKRYDNDDGKVLVRCVSIKK